MVHNSTVSKWICLKEKSSERETASQSAEGFKFSVKEFRLFPRWYNKAMDMKESYCNWL